MCSEIFSRKRKHSSCNLSSFKDKSVRQIFWKAILEQNDSVRFSDGWSESKSRTFYFLTSSFSRICLFWFSDDKILTKIASFENKIRIRGGEDSFERATREAKQQLKELKWYTNGKFRQSFSRFSFKWTLFFEGSSWSGLLDLSAVSFWAGWVGYDSLEIFRSLG